MANAGWIRLAALGLAAGWLAGSPATVSAQALGVGLKVGVPLTEAFDTIQDATRGYVSKTRRWTLGPQIELRLPFGFGVELDALYTRVGYDATAAAGLRTVEARNWEFPVMGKYRFKGKPAVKPFIGAGVSFRRLTDITQTGNFLTGDVPPELRERGGTGFVVGGGVEIKLLVLRISPEIRFTRWGTENFASGVGGLLKTNVNQGQFLVGFGF